MSKVNACITGIAGYVPDYILTNQELEKLVETSDEWILSRTGIKERRILKGEGLGTSHMAEKAVKDLLAKTNTDPSEIDLLICCTTTPDYVFPATGNIISDMCGLKNAFSYDMNAACSGFLFGLVTGSQYIESGRFKKVIVVGADKMSAIVNYKDRNTCILFGDGAGAVLLEPNHEGFGVVDSVLKTDGSGAKYLIMKGGGSRHPATLESVMNNEHFAHQEGATVFKFAVKNMSDVAAEIMERNKLTGDNVQWLVPHQANKRIINATAERMNVGPEKVMINIERYGNTTSATIPLVLWDYEKQLKKGDNLVLAAFGGGFTWGSVYLKWGYDPK
ncbi:beta-ketoacyl-ACP synthase III [uncultured Cytophaga sp.]|uniref:beta-ketoacyl-ACP synthase III n=1 Tax=uncultured Cytophaga sp. TaxID=160238 RepID=UPI00262493C2|nr:beta-ketoacyl-ACP synthase III [uncultured Cytophaga sp.]